MATLHESRPPTPGRYSERTAWVGRLTPLRRFIRTETGGAALLVAAVLAGLVWANIGDSYQEVWETHLAVTLGDAGIGLTLHEWVNSGLMTFFFLVVGLEARREFDLGELRERRRLVLPLLAGIGGMAAVGRDLPGPQPGWTVRRRLGDRDGERHRPRGRAPRGRGATRAAAPARVRPDRARRQRSRRAGPDRRGLLR